MFEILIIISDVLLRMLTTDNLFLALIDKHISIMWICLQIHVRKIHTKSGLEYKFVFYLGLWMALD